MKVVGIKLNDVGKVYYFDATNVNVEIGDSVIVETEKGLQYGIVSKEIEDKGIDKNLEYKPVVRKASKSDYKRYLSNLKDANKALVKCNELIEQYNLDMRIIDVSYTFDREQLLFHFISDGRVDFRQLAKDLGSIFKTRIELRQVGIRDKAKEVGGFGPCGRKMCCCAFLNEFDSVSINMAKNQNLSLNPSKINGACGRLLCCLKYEDDNYLEYKKDLPELGSMIKNEYGEGRVIEVNIFDKTYKILTDDSNIIEVNVGQKDGSKE